MTLYLHEADLASPSTRAPSAPRPRAASAASGMVLLLAWAVSIGLALDGLVRAHVAPVAAFAEVSAAALPAMAGVALVRLAHSRSARSRWTWLGTVPTVAGWYVLAHLV